MTPNSLTLAGASLRGRRRIGLLATFVVLLLAAVGMAAGLAVARQGAPLLDAAARDASVAHLVAYGEATALETIASDPEVEASAGPFAALDGVEMVVGDEPIPIHVTALDDPDIAVNRPPITDGRWATSADEVVLDHSLATDVGADVGDTLTFHAGSTSVSMTMVGTAVNFTDCFYPMCDPGRTWVTSTGFDRFDADDERFDEIWLRFDDASQADPFIERMAATGTAGITGSDSWLDTRADFLALDEIFGSFVSAFGVFVLVCAAVVVAGSTATRIVARRREIGLLGAIGCTPREIATSLLVENVAVGVVAATIGWALAGFAVPSLQIGIGATLGPQDPTWSFWSLAVPAVLVVIVLSVATLVPAVRAARRPVTDVLRDVPRGGASWINRRMARLPRHLSLLGVREAASQPTRSALAALAVSIAVVGTLASTGFVGAIEGVAADPARQGDPWDLAIDPGSIASTEIADALDTTPGVATWFGEVERRSTLDGGAFLSVATGGDMAAIDYRIAEGRTVRAPGEAIAGYGFLQRFDREVGDRVDVLVGTTPLTFVIVGWYRETEDSGEILRYPLADLDTVTPSEPDVYRVAVAASAEAATVGTALTARLGPDAGVEVVDTGIDDVQPFLFALRLIAGMLIVMAAANLLATLLASNREASGRTGVELTVGLTPWQVTAQGMVAGATTGLLACAVGIPLGLLLFRLLADTVSTGMGVGPGWMPMPGPFGTAMLAVATIAATGILGGAAIARQVRRPASDLVRAE